MLVESSGIQWGDTARTHIQSHETVRGPGSSYGGPLSFLHSVLFASLLTAHHSGTDLAATLGGQGKSRRGENKVLVRV